MLSLINHFVYRPDATFAPPDLTPADLGLAYEPVALKAADGPLLEGWYLPAPGARQALLYCHGNAGSLGDWVQAAPPFVESGVSLLIFDYRGYGRSEGKPSESGLFQDGWAAWVWLKEQAKKEGLPAFILGKSLGSAVAISVAAREQPAGLVLDSAFTSMREVIAQNAAWLPQRTIPRLYESLELVPQIHCPTLVVHGGRDMLVHPEHGRRLYQRLAGPKALAMIDLAGHNDISLFPEYHRQIGAFLRDPQAFTAAAP